MSSKTNRAKLTKSYLDRVRPGAKDEFHWDSEVKGFGLRVTPTGKTTFIVQGRVEGSGKEARITVGPYGVFTVVQARDVAREHLRTMRMGTDLRRQDEAMAVTLGQVCHSYVTRPGKLKQSTADEYQRQVDKVFADWKGKPIVAITEDDVRKRHREVMENGLGGKRGAPASANSAMIILRILCNFAGRQYRRADGSPLIQRNPVGVLKDHWAKLGSRTDRYVDRRKIGEVWNALNDARLTPKNRDHLSAIDLTMFALLTGARRDEMTTLTWDRVNIDEDEPANCWWHLDERKRGDPLSLPLSSQAVALLKMRPRRKLPDGTLNPWVFPSWSRTGHITDARAPMELISEVAGKHLSLHDARRSFSNYAMRECRIGKFETDLLTGHKPHSDDITARAYLDLDKLYWLQPEVQKIGNWIEEQAAVARGENVVALRAKGIRAPTLRVSRGKDRGAAIAPHAALQAAGSANFWLARFTRYSVKLCTRNAGLHRAPLKEEPVTRAGGARGVIPPGHRTLCQRGCLWCW